MKARPRVIRSGRPEPRRVGRPPIAPGSGGSERNDLALPHERDESMTGQTHGEPLPVMQQAYEDITSGQVDTDMRATPGLDARRRRALVRRR